MVKAMRIAALTAISVGVLVAGTEAQAPKEGWCQNQSVEAHLDRAKTIIKHAYANDRWKDPTPATQSEKDAWRKHSLCLGDYGHKRVQNYKEARQEHFEKYREAKLEAIEDQQFQQKYRPYGPCASVGYLAVPCSVAECESGYSWTIKSTFSGGGMYGILTSTWNNPAYGGAQFASQPYYATPNEQSIVARRIYWDAGPAAWQCTGNW